MLLDGKRILVTGVLNDSSIAFGVAQRAQEEGAEVILTSFGRAMSLTQRTVKRLPRPADVVELDVTDPAHLDGLADAVGARLDGVVHAIAFAPESCLGGGFLDAPWEDVAVAFQISTYSLKALAVAALPLMEQQGGSIVGLDFDNTQAWPVYDWMGVAKSAFESTARYLARDLGPKGIRVNLVCAGPLRTIAAKSIPGFDRFEEVWAERAPLGWDIRDTEPVARACVALLSDLFPATTGEMLHVDGGFHAVGAKDILGRMADDDAKREEDRLLLALTTEHFVLQSTRATITGEGGSRAALYVGALSSTLIALGFATQFEDVLAVIAGAVLPALLILGVFTYVRLVEIGVEDLHYVGRILRIERYYRELSPQAFRYIPAPRVMGEKAKLEAMGFSPRTRFQFLFTVASMIAAINSIVAGAIVALLLDGGLGVARGVAIAAAILVALAVMTLHALDEIRRYGRMHAADAAIEAELDADG